MPGVNLGWGSEQGHSIGCVCVWVQGGKGGRTTTRVYDKARHHFPSWLFSIRLAGSPTQSGLRWPASVQGGALSASCQHMGDMLLPLTMRKYSNVTKQKAACRSLIWGKDFLHLQATSSCESLFYSKKEKEFDGVILFFTLQTHTEQPMINCIRLNRNLTFYWQIQKRLSC